MSYDIGATGAVDADSIRQGQQGGGTTGSDHSGSRKRRKTGLSAVTLTAKYKATEGTPRSPRGALDGGQPCPRL